MSSVSRRIASTRQKADMQEACLIHSRQRNEESMDEHPQNVRTLDTFF